MMQAIACLEGPWAESSSKPIVMIRRLFAVLIAGLISHTPAFSQVDVDSVNCLDTESALAFWRPVREAVRTGGASGIDSDDAERFAPALLDCLASPHSELRDRIGYELLTFWLRSEALSAATQKQMLTELQANLGAQAQEDSLRRSFSALILSELLRADNNAAFMTDAERLSLLHDSVAALVRETDYRGFTEELGWVHPVAHMADILWRFALHSALTQEQAELILQGVRSQAGTPRIGFTFNESDRLARSIATLMARRSLPQSAFVAWLGNYDSPTAADDWSSAFTSVAGMRELHNSKAFVRALSDQLQGQDIHEAVRVKLDELVQLFTAIV